MKNMPKEEIAAGLDLTVSLLQWVAEGYRNGQPPHRLRVVLGVVTGTLQSVIDVQELEELHNERVQESRGEAAGEYDEDGQRMAKSMARGDRQ